jgi:hypothetical protein
MGPTESSATGSASATLTAPAEAADWRGRLRAVTYALYRRRGVRSALPVEGEVERLVELIDEGRALPSAPPTLTRVTAEALGGAIVHELCLAAARETSLPPEAEVVPMLMYSAVLPYAGDASAAEELRIPPPPR